jgi:hypothetical protein
MADAGILRECVEAVGYGLLSAGVEAGHYLLFVVSLVKVGWAVYVRFRDSRRRE